MLAPWTYAYLIESAGRPMQLFRLSYTSWLSLKSGSAARLQQSDSGLRCHQEPPRVKENIVVNVFWSAQSGFVFLDRAEAHSLFVLQSCVLGCEGNVADVRKSA